MKTQINLVPHPLNPAEYVLFAFLALNLFTSLTMASESPVQPSKQWGGSLTNMVDRALMQAAPDCIASAEDLKKLWEKWRIEAPVPEVDYSKEIVVVLTSEAATLRLRATLDDKGNLRVSGIKHGGLAPGFRYVIATVSRQRVKYVNWNDAPSAKLREP